MDPEKSENNAEVTQENPNDGMVDVHDASIQDLDEALKNAEAEEANQSPAAPSDESESNENSPSVNNQPNGESGQKPGEEAPSQKPGVATQGASPSKPAQKQGEVQGNEAEIERLRKQGEQKELFIQHRGNELGQLKTQFTAQKQELERVRAQLASGLEDRAAESPIKAMEDRDTIKLLDDKIAKIDNDLDGAETIVEAQTFFLRHIDTEKVSLDDVANVLRADGLDDRMVAQFKSNPWRFTTPEALVQMGKRAMDRKELSIAANDRSILATAFLKLQEENKKLKTKPQSVMAQVQRNLRASPPITSQSTSSPKTAKDLDPTKMSLSEIDAAIANSNSYMNLQ